LDGFGDPSDKPVILEFVDKILTLSRNANETGEERESIYMIEHYNMKLSSMLQVQEYGDF